MLEEMAKAGDECVISWQPHGKAFRVHLPQVFGRSMMPRFFKQTKHNTFLRQFQVCGFHRISEGLDRNKKSMNLQTSCQKINGKKSSYAVRHYAAGNPSLCSSATNVDND
jgi:hypothetical protein